MTAADTLAVETTVKSAGATTNAFATHVFTTLVPATLPLWTGTTSGYPYVIIHPGEGNDDTDRVTAPRTTTHPEFTLHFVGLTAVSVQKSMELVKPKFVTGGRFICPTVSGRRNKLGYWRFPLPTLQTDRDVTPWLIYGVVELGWTSDPT